MKRKICIATGTRADWGLLSGIARGLAERPDIELQIVATNMHLEEMYGYTIDEIRADGFRVDREVPMHAASDSQADTVRAMSLCMTGMADALEELRPDIVVILGDRYEMLAVASAATVMRIPIVHIAGGEISEGAIDDSIRHAITKLSALHLTATEPYRQRVIRMGEDAELVLNTGAIGVYNAINEPRMSREELSNSTGIDVTPDTLLVTYHPATLDDTDTASRCDALFEALGRFPDNPVIITYPNNDANGRIIIDRIQQFVATRPQSAVAIPSLGKRRYLSALACVGAVVGNSSSGIVEVPSFGIPTVNIGIRQRGRIASESVIHCGDSADEIAEAISTALSTAMKEKARKAENPYFKPDTLRTIVTAIAETPIERLKHKKFHD